MKLLIIGIMAFVGLVGFGCSSKTRHYGECVVVKSGFYQGAKGIVLARRSELYQLFTEGTKYPAYIDVHYTDLADCEN
jgi:hypothetical protein